MGDLKDNGTIHKFDTGAIREGKAGKGWPTEIPTQPLRDLALHYERGGLLRSRSNWRKGFPLSSFLESAQRHLWDIIDGKTDEDHVSAVVWNVFGYKWTKSQIDACVLPKNLNDLQTYQNFEEWVKDQQYKDSLKKDIFEKVNDHQIANPVEEEYYYLKEGDIIKEGDEMSYKEYPIDIELWMSPPEGCIGATAGKCKVRRKIVK